MSKHGFTEDPMVRQSIIDALCVGIVNTSEFIDEVDYIINDLIPKYKVKLDGFLYDDEDKLINLILPSFRRVWSKVYIDTPSIFEMGFKHDEHSLRLYQLLFTTDDFVDFLVNKLVSTKNCLSEFENIDKSLTHLTIIVDDYLGYLLKRVDDCKDIKTEIRKIKIDNINDKK